MGAHESKAVQELTESKGDAREFTSKVGKSLKREYPRITFPQHIYPFLASIHCKRSTPATIIFPNGDQCNGILSRYSSKLQTYYQLRIPKTSCKFSTYLRAFPLGDNITLGVSRASSSIVVTFLRVETVRRKKTRK